MKISPTAYWYDRLRVDTAYRLELDSVACIGCVACTRCQYFEMRPDMKAHAVQEIVFELGCVLKVAEECPVGAITCSRIPH